MLFSIITIIFFGALLITTASPNVAERIGLHSFFFVHKQFIFLFISINIIVALSFLNEQQVKKLALLGFIISTLAMIAVLFIGEEVKGAKRWISLPGSSIQPSEFLKPFFAIVIAIILAERNKNPIVPGFSICFILYSLVAFLLVLQPDIGMTIAITLVTAGQLFIAGLPIIFIIIAALFGILGAFSAYMLLPHVAKRINSFLNPEENENYQVEKSLEAYINGGLFGKGPGEGTVKSILPDSHTDFIFAVAGEELGALLTSAAIILFLFVTVRGLIRVYKNNDLFLIYSVSGIMMYFALQSIFNIGVTLNLFPTKGMTLPFISYGGSSIFSYAIGIGMVLALTKRKPKINFK
jgi:cell division protein FtsW